MRYISKSNFFHGNQNTFQLLQSSHRINNTKIHWMHTSSYENLRICFVHTPMSSVTVPGRDMFWLNFDKRYYAVHPGLKPADASIWELPHWMTWLGGALKAEKFKNVNALSLYTAVNIKDGINRNFIATELERNPADIYLYSPMTPNLHFAYDIASMVKARYPNSVNVFGGDHNLPVCSFIINGLPEQTPNEMRSSIDMVCELLNEKLLHASYFFGLVPYPGSLMYKNPEKFGMKLKHHDYQYYNEDLEPVYDTEHAKSEEIYKVFLEGVQKIGHAMSAKPYLGEELNEDVANKLGKSLTHV